MSAIEKLLNLVRENPDLPIVPMVDGELVADTDGYWMGKWGKCEIGEYYLGEEKVHFKDDDMEMFCAIWSDTIMDATKMAMIYTICPMMNGKNYTKAFLG